MAFEKSFQSLVREAIGSDPGGDVLDESDVCLEARFDEDLIGSSNVEHLEHCGEIARPCCIRNGTEFRVLEQEVGKPDCWIEGELDDVLVAEQRQGTRLESFVHNESVGNVWDIGVVHRSEKGNLVFSF